MSAVTASLCSTLMFVLFVSADQKTITAESGQKNVTLTCKAPNNNITAVEWSRADLEDKCVLLYQRGQFVTDDQHPSFKDRVDLQDRRMKDGDVSLILKDVKTDDAETYLCRVYMEETSSWELINSTYLIVDPLDKKTISAESGQNITLPCRAPNKNITIIVVKWTKPVLKPELVLLYRDKGLNPHNQHPSFKDRVDLQDRQMKDGDVSLILKNVTINDTGTYACRVFVEETRSWAFRRFISLTVVDPPGHTGGYPVWKIGLIVVLLGVAVIFPICCKIYKKIQQWRIKCHKQDQRSAVFSKLTSDSPPAVPRSHNTTRRKTDNQGQKETDDADLQSPV